VKRDGSDQPGGVNLSNPKPGRRRAILLALIVALLAGSNWIQLLAFRSQMRAFQEFTAWERTGAAGFVFKKPLFTLEYLNGLGLYPEKKDSTLSEKQRPEYYSRFDFTLRPNPVAQQAGSGAQD